MKDNPKCKYITIGIILYTRIIFWNSESVSWFLFSIFEELFVENPSRWERTVSKGMMFKFESSNQENKNVNRNFLIKKNWNKLVPTYIYFFNFFFLITIIVKAKYMLTQLPRYSFFLRVRTFSIKIIYSIWTI